MNIIVQTFIAALFVQVGYFIWKLAAVELPRIGQVPHLVVLKVFFTSWKWLLGMCLRLIGLFLFVKVTEHGALSLVQPLMSIGDIFIVFLAVIFLRERLVRIEWFGLLFVIAGAWALSSEVHPLARTPLNWTHAAIFIGVAFVILVSLIILGRKRKPEIFFGISVGMAFGVSMVLAKLMTSHMALRGQPIDLVACITSPISPFIIINNVIGLILLQVAF